MDLKEYIKSLVRQQLEEESTTAGVPGYMTPRAFSPKGQKTNAATKQAGKEGWKVTKGETTMPSDSKLYDYKTLTGKKKKGVKIYEVEKPKFEKGDRVEYGGREWTVNVDSTPNIVVLKSDEGTFTHAIPSQVKATILTKYNSFKGDTNKLSQWLNSLGNTDLENLYKDVFNNDPKSLSIDQIKTKLQNNTNRNYLQKIFKMPSLIA